MWKSQKLNKVMSYSRKVFEDWKDLNQSLRELFAVVWFEWYHLTSYLKLIAIIPDIAYNLFIYLFVCLFLYLYQNHYLSCTTLQEGTAGKFRTGIRAFCFLIVIDRKLGKNSMAFVRMTFFITTFCTLLCIYIVVNLSERLHKEWFRNGFKAIIAHY